MPELPEVETLKRYLEDKIIASTILECRLQRDNLRHALHPNLTENIVRSKITSVSRRAKYLLINLDTKATIVVHLGMSGRFTLQAGGYELRKHDHVILHLDTAQLLVFNDARRFGMIYYFPEAKKILTESIFQNLGPEPLEDDFNAQYLQSRLANKKMPIKNALMDQSVVVGVGNIYSSESLFSAGINPQRPAGSLSGTEISRLVDSIKTTLHKAIKAGGTTLKDFVNGNNSPGYFQQELMVYGRAGRKCPHCETILSSIRQAGRVSFYCKICQE